LQFRAQRLEHHLRTLDAGLHDDRLLEAQPLMQPVQGGEREARRWGEAALLFVWMTGRIAEDMNMRIAGPTRRRE
jgi:hypothetical protein